MANNPTGALKREWEARARSPHRDYFVASHPGWNDSGAWDHQARADAALLLTGLTPEWLGRARVLEIGCGIGRLVPPLLERCRDYTGLDIAVGMVAEAERRFSGEDRSRFFVADGQSIPANALDCTYELVLCHAVLIHCPLEVITRLTYHAVRAISPGGRFRFQLRANQHDPTGIAVPPSAVPAAESMLEPQVQALPSTSADLVDANYAGHAFRYDHVPALFPDWGELRLVRTDPLHIYGEWTP